MVSTPSATHDRDMALVSSTTEPTMARLRGSSPARTTKLRSSFTVSTGRLWR